MEDLQKLFSSKNITESSKNLYIKNLTRLNGGEIKNLKFLQDEKSILTKLEKYAKNTQRTYIISIVSLLKALSNQKKYKKLYDTYYCILEEMNKELKTSNTKTVKEQENWISQQEVLERLDELKKIIPEVENKRSITEDQYKQIQNLLLLALYALQKPRRNRDYQYMVIYKKSPPIENLTRNVLDIKGNQVQVDIPNILDLKNNRFIFTNFKTQKTYSNQEIAIVPELRQIIDLYLKFHPLYKSSKVPVTFIVSFTGQEYKNNNDMTRLLYKIFNKKIGVNMLRHIYLTDKCKDAVEDMNEDAKQMGTSSTTIQDHYIKV